MAYFKYIDTKIKYGRKTTLVMSEFSLSKLFELYNEVNITEYKKVRIIVNYKPTQEVLINDDIKKVMYLNKESLDDLISILSDGIIVLEATEEAILTDHLIVDGKCFEYNQESNWWNAYNKSGSAELSAILNSTQKINTQIVKFLKSLNKLMISLEVMIEKTDNVFSQNIHHTKNISNGRISKYGYSFFTTKISYKLRVSDFRKNNNMISSKVYKKQAVYLSTVLKEYNISTLNRLFKTKVYVTTETIRVRNKRNKRFAGRNYIGDNEFIDRGHEENYIQNVMLKDDVRVWKNENKYLKD